MSDAPCPRVDGCSGGVSWFYRHILRSPAHWEYCCDEHDVAYSEGGTPADRALADRRLRECIADAGYPVWAWVYWAAVRAFGWRQHHRASADRVDEEHLQGDPYWKADNRSHYPDDDAAFQGILEGWSYESEDFEKSVANIFGKAA